MTQYRKEDLEKRYPLDGFRYVRDKKTGLFYNFTKQKWVPEVALATQISPASQKTLREGASLARRIPVDDIEFVR